jgi:hypothetical protein
VSHTYARVEIGSLMVYMRRMILIALFVLLVALSCLILGLPVVKALLTLHSDWAGFPSWMFEALWTVVTLSLSVILVAALFGLFRFVIRRVSQQH